MVELIDEKKGERQNGQKREQVGGHQSETQIEIFQEIEIDQTRLISNRVTDNGALDLNGRAFRQPVFV